MNHLMVVHFIYAGREDSDRPCSPYTITRHVLDFLRGRGLNVKYYDWCQTGPADVGPDDLILGHPNYGDETIVRWMFRNVPRCRAKCLISPFSHGMPELSAVDDTLIAATDTIFAITGPYWWDTWHTSTLAHWKPKMVRLDMAVDLHHFPRVKTSFNPSGRRGLVYIGRESPEKGTDVLYETLRRIPECPFYYYGPLGALSPLRSLPNFHGGYKVRTEDPAFARQLTRDADIYVTFGRSDANPTTLLEAIGWGLIPCCTPTSGYWPDERCDNLFTGLSLDDINYNVRQIQSLNFTDEVKLMDRATSGRQIVSGKYTWEKFCDALWKGLERYILSEPLHLASASRAAAA